MEDLKTSTDLIGILTTLSPMGSAFLACAWLARELRRMTDRMIGELKNTVDRNTTHLKRVEFILGNCAAHGDFHDGTAGKEKPKTRGVPGLP